MAVGSGAAVPRGPLPRAPMGPAQRARELERFLDPPRPGVQEALAFNV